MSLRTRLGLPTPPVAATVRCSDCGRVLAPADLATHHTAVHPRIPEWLRRGAMKDLTGGLL